MSLPQISKEQIAVVFQDMVQFKPCRRFKETAIENPFGVSAREKGRNGETQFVEKVCARQLGGDAGAAFGQHVFVTTLAQCAQRPDEVNTVVTGHDHVGHLSGAGSVVDRGRGTQACEQGRVGRPAQGCGMSVEGADTVDTCDHVQAYSRALTVALSRP